MKIIGGIYCALWLLACVACGVSQPPKQAPSVSSSVQQNQSAPPPPAKPQPPAEKPVQAQAQKSLSYATDPDRFIKQQTTEPVLNITDPQTPQEHFNVAVYADNHKQMDKAIAEYKKALELNPNWALAHFRVGSDFQKQGREDDAIAHWEQAARLDPQLYLTYDYLSAAYARQGRIDKAIEAYSGLLKYPPAQLPAHYQLGLWYAQIGKRAEARKHLESYRELALHSKEQESDRFRKALKTLETLR